MENNLFLTCLLLTPLIGGLLLLFINKQHESLIKIFGMAVSAIAFIESLAIYAYFNPSVLGFQFVHRFSWIQNINIDYHVGIDGISLLLLLLTTFLTPITLLSAWNSIKEKVKEYILYAYA
jgi:NADH-quinone oxidoreductase subunit M